jgi:biotin carboxyl carrier protein
MKLQTTLCAAIAGTVADLPFAAGQSFQRGAVLARVHPAEAAA